MGDEQCSPAALIRRLLAVLADEVDRNPRLARKIAAALPQSIARAAPAARPRGAFNPLDYHPVKILREHGEDMLRGKLLRLNNREKLRSVAKAANLTLGPQVYRARATVADVVEAIVTAAAGYDRQRKAAVDD
jgi:hypothetical protein